MKGHLCHLLSWHQSGVTLGVLASPSPAASFTGHLSPTCIRFSVPERPQLGTSSTEMTLGTNPHPLCPPSRALLAPPGPARGSVCLREPVCAEAFTSL